MFTHMFWIYLDVHSLVLLPLFCAFTNSIEISILGATLDKGSRNNVQWNRAFLLVKNFKLVPRLLDEGSRSRRIKLWFGLHDILLKGKPIDPNKKKSLKESLWFGKSKCKLAFNVDYFLFVVFFHCLFSFTFVAQILWEWKTCYGLRILLRLHQLPHFLPILELT